jgi:hypothetical protein
LSDISEAIYILQKALNDAYYYAWQSNIAMAHIDAERWYKKENNKKFLNKKDKHIIANNAAKYFLDLLKSNPINPFKQTRCVLFEKFHPIIPCETIGL